MVDDVETDNSMKDINYNDIKSENSEEYKVGKPEPKSAPKEVKQRIENMLMKTETPQEYYQK